MMNFVLRDGEKAISGTVEENGVFLEIHLDGYGEACANDGCGSSVVIDFYGGKPKVLVFAYINNEDPTHIIDLANAREELRTQMEE